MFKTNFLSDLNKKIKQYELKSSSIVIEISENTFVRDTEECIKRINAFKKSGFLIAIDDFGSEYSSLGILDNIPFDILKLDGVFAQRYESETMMKIATTVSQVALKQGKTIIVEQIETLEQAEIFKTMNCFIHQGYYYHKPERFF